MRYYELAGGIMKYKKTKSFKRRFTSLLLIIAVMVGLLVPFDLTVFAS